MPGSDTFLRIESLRWDASNECTTLQETVESYMKAYGHYPQRVLALVLMNLESNRQDTSQNSSFYILLFGESKLAI